MAFTIRIINRSEIDKIIEFHKSALSDTGMLFFRDRKEFEWLFFSEPSGKTLYACASDTYNNEIIGTQAGIFIPMINRKGEKIITLKGEDTLVSLDQVIQHGSPDILKEMFRFIFERSGEMGIDLIWGFTPAASAFKRCGFSIVTQITNSYYVIKPLAFFNNRIKSINGITPVMKLKLLVFSFVNIALHSIKFKSRADVSLRNISIDDLDENLLISFIPEGVFDLHLSGEYLKWRITDNPSSNKYEILEASSVSGIILCYIIMSHDKENIWYIEHLLFADSTDEKFRTGVVLKAFRYARLKGAIFIKAPGFDHNEANRKEKKLLKGAGCYFFKNSKESYYIFKTITQNNVNPEDIFLSRLNTQGIR